MKKKTRRRRKLYRLSDLRDMAEQLGCRLRFELLPVELFTPKPLPDPPVSPSDPEERP